MPSSCIDAVITDPPAGINFMGKAWDSDRGGATVWIAWLTKILAECYRLLRPGGHIFVWALPRTSHWTATAIENAGFELRDRVLHLFGNGMPKSLDVAKAIDKRLGVARIPVGPNPNHRAVSGVNYRGIYAGGNTGAAVVTRAGSRAARAWEDWQTGLKPNVEDWWLGRKPLEGTVADNVLQHGVGALNIGACRLGPRDRTNYGLSNATRRQGATYGAPSASADFDASKGRWPGNVILGEEIVPLLAPHDRFFYTPKPNAREKALKNGRKNSHPTVKSVALMRHLCRLVTPERGLVLDPFAGSGSTGVACALEGLSFIGVEQDQAYHEIALERVIEAFNPGRP